ncbi:hypothetical protein [Reyranella sp.]|uniref:hypothetical protein n=1 Tax=Reyranella sp. TaxID=1929291 RepID=UPI003D107B1F
MAHDDPARPAMPMDEQALEAELQAAEIEARARRWNWGWVNRPITLWALSTIAVGVLSFTYTQFSTCRARVDTDSARYMRLVEELSFRSGAIYGIARGADTDIAAVLSVLDPAQTYLFAEFKDRLPNELVAEARQLLRKWHSRELSAYEVASRDRATELMKKAMAGSAADGQPFSVQTYLEFILKDPPGPGITASVAGMAAPGGVFDLLTGWTVVHRVLRVEHQSASLATVSDWARALGNGFAAFTADDAQLQLASTRTCLRRAFWPFD